MKTFKKLSISTALLVLSLGITGHASATCSINGKVMRSYSNQGDWSYFYFAPQSSGIVSYNWWAAVSPADPSLRALLANAHSGDKTVYLNGNAATCPNSGTYRYAGRVLNANVYTLH